MSVPESERSEGKLEVLTRALEVSTYSIKILANQKKFDCRYDHVLGNDLKTAALAVYRYTWFANDVDTKTPEARQVRYELQQRAIGACNDLLVFINIAHMIYHMKAQRAEHWINLVLESRAALRKWQETDRLHYASYGKN